MRLKIKNILSEENIGKSLTAHGWIKTVRKQKTLSFIAINDGSCFSNLQIVFDKPLEQIDEISTGACISVEGTIVKSPAAGQSVEMKGEKILKVIRGI